VSITAAAPDLRDIAAQQQELLARRDALLEGA